MTQVRLQFEASRPGISRGRLILLGAPDAAVSFHHASLALEI